MQYTTIKSCDCQDCQPCSWVLKSHLEQQSEILSSLLSLKSGFVRIKRVDQKGIRFSSFPQQERKQKAHQSHRGWNESARKTRTKPESEAAGCLEPHSVIGAKQQGAIHQVLNFHLCVFSPSGSFSLWNIRSFIFFVILFYKWGNPCLSIVLFLSGQNALGDLMNCILKIFYAAYGQQSALRSVLFQTWTVSWRHVQCVGAVRTCCGIRGHNGTQKSITFWVQCSCIHIHTYAGSWPVVDNGLNRRCQVIKDSRPQRAVLPLREHAASIWLQRTHKVTRPIKGQSFSNDFSIFPSHLSPAGGRAPFIARPQSGRGQPGSDQRPPTFVRRAAVSASSDIASRFVGDFHRDNSYWLRHSLRPTLH